MAKSQKTGLFISLKVEAPGMAAKPKERYSFIGPVQIYFLINNGHYCNSK